MDGATEAVAGERDDVLLEVEDLHVDFRTGRRKLPAVRGVSFDVRRGEVLALVGESGSGKSTTGLAIMGLLRGEDSLARSSGRVWLSTGDGERRDLLGLPERAMRHVRGNDVSMVFQEPMSSLNPVFTVGLQVVEAIRAHRSVARREARDQALQLLEWLGIPHPARCLVSYPHQLSGGMRQRVMLAMGLASHPSLLIADEPTTALDVTIQAQILEYLRRVQQDTDMAVLYITHDLGVVSEIADRALVMYAGQIVEAGGLDTVFGRPLMPYTRGLLRSVPRVGHAREGGRRIEAIPGNVPSPLSLPSGCAFNPRCQEAVAGRCDRLPPTLEACSSTHLVRCLRWRELGSDVS